MKIIGISGTNGSGKDTAGSLLAEKYNLLFVSVSDLLRIECRKRGLEVRRENLRMISAEWRREFGLGVLVDKAVDFANGSARRYDGVVASPMRNVAEAKHLKDIGGTLVWIDADPELRYARIQATHRGRAGEDDKTYEQFLQEEHDEMYPSNPRDPAALNVAGVKALTDAIILNESDLEQLKTNLEKNLKLG